MIKRYILVIFVLLSLPGFGQITFQFVPEVYGRNVNGLFNCKITNQFTPQAVSLTVTVTERSGGVVCSIKTREFTLITGTNNIPVSAAQSASVQFSNNKLGRLTRLNRAFPEGDYDYCYTLSFSRSDNPPEEQCFSYTLAPFAEFNLIEPGNKDSICSTRPLFTWEPLIPSVPGAAYQLVLSEIKGGQNATEALNYNLPVINQLNIASPVLPYPSIVRELEQKKRYAWQVTAYKDQTVLNRSEVWEFVVNCHDTTKRRIPEVGFRSIEDLLKGNYYLADGYIKFALVNPYQDHDLKYEIHPVANPRKKIRGLPKLKLVNGINNITLDLSSNSAFEDNHYYILQILLPNGTQKNLRFLYLEQP